MSIFSLNLQQFKTEIVNDCDSIGRFVGIADLLKQTWKFCIYIGNEKLALLYDGSTTSGIIKSNFKPLSGEKNLVKTDFLKLKFDFLVELSEFRPNECHYEFFVYKMNLFQTSKEFKLNTLDLVKTLQINMERLHELQEGDIVSFERGLYSHHGLLTGLFCGFNRMLVLDVIR